MTSGSALVLHYGSMYRITVVQDNCHFDITITISIRKLVVVGRELYRLNWRDTRVPLVIWLKKTTHCTDAMIVKSVVLVGLV